LKSAAKYLFWVIVVCFLSTACRQAEERLSFGASREFVEARLALFESIPDTAYACGDVCALCYKEWDSAGLVSALWSELDDELASGRPVCILERGTSGEPWGLPSYQVSAIIEKDKSFIAVSAEVRVIVDEQERAVVGEPMVSFAPVNPDSVMVFQKRLTDIGGVCSGQLPVGFRYSAHACCAILTVNLEDCENMVALMPVKGHLAITLRLDSTLTAWSKSLQ